MATTQITGLNPIGVVNDSDLILIHSGVEDFKGTVTDLKTNLNNTYLKITDNLTTVQDKPAAFNAIKQYATTTSSGVLEIADNTETITGTDTSRAVVPSGLKAAMTDRDVLAGNGLTGGGNLGSDVTITLGTPSTITDVSTNNVTGTTHTHAITAASTTAKGVIEIATSAETITGSDTARAIVPSGLQAKLADIDIIAGNGLITGGNLGSDVTLNMGTPSTITGTSTNSVTADSHTHAIDIATSTIAGVFKVSNSPTDDSASLVPTCELLELVRQNKLSTVSNLSDLNNKVFGRNNLGIYSIEMSDTLVIGYNEIAGATITRVPSTSVGQFRVTHNLGQCIPQVTVHIGNYAEDTFANIKDNTSTYTDVIVHNNTSEVDKPFYLTLTKQNP